MTPRLVEVVVSIESPQFRDGLGDARRQQIESTIATEVAASLAQQFPLIEWQAGPGAVDPAGQLIAAIAEPSNASPDDDSFLPEVSLLWRAAIGGEDLAMRSVFPQTLYSASNAERPVHDDRGAFMKLLRERVVGWVQSDTNTAHLQSEFLKYVPLATSVRIQPDQQLVVIPVPWEQSRLGEQSEFSVSYRGGEAGPEKTRVMLSGVARRLTDPLPGNTQSHVAGCTRGGADVDAAQFWQTCVDPLNRNPQQKLLVSIEKYVYDANPDVLDGMIVDDQ
jgi:hypothetical protein